jgi:hypothetical protein
MQQVSATSGGGRNPTAATPTNRQHDKGSKKEQSRNKASKSDMTALL